MPTPAPAPIMSAASILESELQEVCSGSKYGIPVPASSKVGLVQPFFPHPTGVGSEDWAIQGQVGGSTDGEVEVISNLTVSLGEETGAV